MCLDNPKYRGDVEYFFRWQDEKTRVIREADHVPMVSDGRARRNDA